MMQKGVLKRFWRDNFYVIVLLVTGSMSWFLTMVKSGIVYPFGMGFWGANGHDGVWHISLINLLARGSREMPVFAGNNIKNYHLGFDLLVAGIHRVTHLPVVNLYFQIIPPILAVLVGISTYLFVIKWTKSKESAIWSIFFIYFGGSLAWIFGMGESTFWSQQAISTLINPPFALSLIGIFFGLYFLVRYEKSRQLSDFLGAIFFLGSLVEVKAYAGILVLGSLMVGGIWQIIKEKRYELFKVFSGSTGFSLILFLFLNRGAENLFIFQPLWFLQTLFNLDRFSIPRVESAISNYNLAQNTTKLIPAYILAFLVFWIGNMGTRLMKEIKVVQWVKNPMSISSMEVFIAVMIMGGVFIPMVVVQQGTPWNTIQFFYYSLVFSGVLGGVAMPKIIEKIKGRNLRYAFIFAVVVFTIPTTLITLKDVYLPGRPPAKISTEELGALEYLRSQPEGVVLTYPYDAVKAKEAENSPPRSLYVYDSTAYVSAFSEKAVFLEDEVNLNITNFNWRERRGMVEEFLGTLDQRAAREFLKENNISYVYWLKGQRAKLGESQLGLVKIFENNEVDVFKVE